MHEESDQHRAENSFLAVGMSLGVAGGAGIGLLLGLLVLGDPAMGVGLGIPFGIALGLMIAIAVDRWHGRFEPASAFEDTGDEQTR